MNIILSDLLEIIIFPVLSKYGFLKEKLFSSSTYSVT